MTVERMPVELVTAPHGAPAAQALRDAVAAAKHGDPLEPVTVVVPTNAIGVTARRLLGSGALRSLVDGTTGVAAVTFLTVYRLAELLGAPSLAAQGRRPVSTPVSAAAIRQVLSKQPGMFAAVAAHPATERALVDASRELAQCDDTALDALRRTGPRATEVVRIVSAARRMLAPDWFDERDLMDAAVHAIASGTGVLTDLGTLVLYLPQDLHEPSARLVRALGDTVPVTVIAGVSGVARADASVRESVARVAVAHHDRAWDRTPVHAHEVLSASDPDDEVRAVVRLIIESMRAGVPGERIAVLVGAAEPYARLLHEQLDAAGIPHNGTAVRTLAQSVLGSSLLGLLALPDRDFHRHDVMALLAGASVYQRDGREVHSARWERLSRDAGIVRGASQWNDALGREIDRLEHELAAERDRTDRDPRPERYEHDLGEARDLRAFVAEVRAELAAGAAPGTSWRALAEWAQHLIDTRLARADRRDSWPEAEQRAADKVEAALERLAGLDAVEPAPGLDVFRRTLGHELDADLGRVGRLGTGVLVGPVAMGVGLDLDVVVVCGLAEGTFPARVRDDSLLPDADRRATDGALALRASRVHEDHRNFLAALASAPRRVLTFPRGDLRRTTERTPSRFLIDTVEALSGQRLTAEELLTNPAPWLTVVPSFTAGVARVTFPATAQEHRLRVLLDHTRAGGRLADHPLRAVDRALHLGIDCIVARASDAFTRFDGNLSALAVPSPTADDVVVSPTRLETWAASPFDYLMEQLLRVEIAELPEEVWELSALDRGRLVHEILDAFLTEVLARPEGAPAPGSPWTPRDRQRLQELAAEHGAVYAAHGLTGRRVFWDRDQRRLAAELDRWLGEDDNGRALDLRTPVATEMRFGLRDARLPALTYPLSDGRTLRFRGAADRVDRGEHGEILVIDYKTGSQREGLALQLPVYARAARAAFGDGDTSVSAAYWYVSTKQKFAWRELPFTPAYERAFDHWLRGIVDGIEHGLFPCVTGEPGAWTQPWRTYTDPDARGARDRWREWERKQHAPELASFHELFDGLPHDDVVSSDGDVTIAMDLS
ncbi:MAG: PD-(D/E)XK nuclease family protein [Acidimicrobiia bacterium]